MWETLKGHHHREASTEAVALVNLSPQFIHLNHSFVALVGSHGVFGCSGQMFLEKQL